MAIRIAGAAGTLRSRDRVEFAPTERGGTRVTLTSELAVGGMLDAAPLVWGMLAGYLWVLAVRSVVAPGP